MRKVYLIIIFLFMLFISSCNNEQVENKEETEKYTVTFYDTNNQVLDVQTIEEGKDAVDPVAKLNLEGYIFIGWSVDFTNVKEDLEVRPSVEKATFTVKFFDENDTLLYEEVVEYGSKVTAPNAPEKEGYIFKKWSENTSSVKSNLEIYPVYNVKVFTVSFIDLEGYIIDQQVVEYGKDAVAPDAPKLEGYKFAGWDQDFTNVTEELTVLPLYEELLYEVKFVDKSGNLIETQYIKAGLSAIAPEAPSVTYYTFTGWDQDFTKVNKDMTVKAQYKKSNFSYAMTTSDYWLYLLSDKYDINETILSTEEINEYNKKILSDYSKTEVKDVLAITSSTTGSYVKSMIDQYTNINKYTVYNDLTKTAISSTEKTSILNNRNYDAIPNNVTVKYGIVVDFAWLRSYPTNYYSNNYDMDRFQETTLNVGEGVAVYHISLDGDWYFVQAENYNGWVEKKNIALCSYDELKAFMQPSERILVISDYMLIENVHVRMGQTFPKLSETNHTYTIHFPKRDNDGNLNLIEKEIAKSAAYHDGYLQYNYKNVFDQALKLLGIDYSWGDKDKYGRDCSSTMNAIYKCFGFMMPRNTSNQVATPTYGVKLSGLSNSSIQNYKPGTLIFTSSHVMLYLGENADGLAYLLHNTTSGNGECILQSLNSYGGSKIIGVLQMQ